LIVLLPEVPKVSYPKVIQMFRFDLPLHFDAAVVVVVDMVAFCSKLVIEDLCSLEP